MKKNTVNVQDKKITLNTHEIKKDYLLAGFMLRARNDSQEKLATGHENFVYMQLELAVSVHNIMWETKGEKNPERGNWNSPLTDGQTSFQVPGITRPKL